MMLTSTRSTIGSFRPLSRATARLRERIVGRRFLVVVLVAIVRVACSRTMSELRFQRASRNGPVPTGCSIDPVAVGLDHLARDRAHDRGVAQVIGEARVRRAELELQRVAVEGAHPGDVAVVVEGLAGERLLAQRVEAEDLVLLDRRQVRALPARVEDAA